MIDHQEVSFQVVVVVVVKVAFLVVWKRKAVAVPLTVLSTKLRYQKIARVPKIKITC